MRIIIMLVAIVAASTACNRSPSQKDFATPEDASQALLVAAKSDNTRALLEVLAALSRTTNFSVGCYCEDEARCHRSLLRELLAKRGAKMG